MRIVKTPCQKGPKGQGVGLKSQVDYHVGIVKNHMEPRNVMGRQI